MTNLRFDDVTKGSSAQEDLKFDHSYICRLQNSTAYKIRIAQKGDKMYLRCSAAFTDMSPVTQEEIRDANDAELKEKEAKLLAQTAVNRFNAQHKNWVYQISDFEGKKLTASVESLLEEKEKAEVETAEPAETPSEPNLPRI